MRVMEVMGQSERSDSEDCKEKREESGTEGSDLGQRKQEEFGRSSHCFFFCVYLSSLTCSLIAKRSSILIGIEVAIVTSL